jgi:hypothetical protein
MAKQPETVDRIVIMAEAPTLEMVGGGLAALTRLGFENVGYKLITEELRYKGRKVHEVSAEEFAFAFIKDNPRFTSRDLVAHFREAGREPGAAYYAAKKLTDGNVIAKNGDGYVRVEALTAPPKKTKTKTTARGQQKPYDVPNIVLITRAIRGRKHITLVELRELFAKEKRPEKSISPILTKLVGAKRLKALGEGKYDVLTPAVKKKPKPKPKSVAVGPAMNGGEVAHG